MRLLFGAILKPSMASRGVASWIGSLAESRASHTASPVYGGEVTTNGTSGLTRPELSERYIQGSFFSKTLAGSSGITGTESGLNYTNWVTRLRKDYSARLRLAHRISDNGSLSWPTPNAGTHGDSDSIWQERRAAVREKHGNNGFGLTLRMLTGVWPTPNTPNGGRGASHAEQNGRTYTNKDGQKVQVGLEWETRRWPTPTTVPEAPNQNSNIKDGGYKTMIQASQGLWPTPSPSKDYSRLPLLPSTNGHMCSPKCRRLNPLFVERLMGWPGGWTLLPTGLTDFESSAMESCRSLLPTRSEHCTGEHWNDRPEDLPSVECEISLPSTVGAQELGEGEQAAARDEMPTMPNHPSVDWAEQECADTQILPGSLHESESWNQSGDDSIPTADGREIGEHRPTDGLRDYASSERQQTGQPHREPGSHDDGGAQPGGHDGQPSPCPCLIRANFFNWLRHMRSALSRLG